MTEAHVLFFFVGLLLFIAFFYGPWQGLCIAWARQLLFEERDKLFLSALNGSLKFESASYREMRNQIELMIRFCHKITWQRLVLSLVISKLDTATDSDVKERIAKIMNVSNETTKKQLQDIRLRMAFAAIVCMMGRSIFLGPLFLLLYCATWLRDFHEYRTTERVFRAVEVEAKRYDSELVYAKASRHYAKV